MTEIQVMFSLYCWPTWLRMEDGLLDDRDPRELGASPATSRLFGTAYQLFESTFDKSTFRGRDFDNLQAELTFLSTVMAAASRLRDDLEKSTVVIPAFSVPLAEAWALSISQTAEQE